MQVGAYGYGGNWRQKEEEERRQKEQEELRQKEVCARVHVAAHHDMMHVSS